MYREKPLTSNGGNSRGYIYRSYPLDRTGDNFPRLLEESSGRVIAEAIKAGHGIHGRTDKNYSGISEFNGFLRTINETDSVSSVALSKRMSCREAVGSCAKQNFISAESERKADKKECGGSMSRRVNAMLAGNAFRSGRKLT
jgi:hypothetical protein